MNTIQQLKETDIDSSLFANFDKSLTKEEYTERVVTMLTPLLERHFADCLPKQQVRIKHDRISIACPHCDDSKKDVYKKRGNIILEGKWKNFYKCHNCSMFQRVDQFFKYFKVNIDLDFINYVSESITNLENQYSSSKYDASLLLDMKLIEGLAIDREELKSIFGLVEVKGSSVWPFLVRRYQFDESKFLYSPKKNYLAILNLTPSGKIIGLQKRLLIKTRNKYNTYKLSKLYEEMKRTVELPEWMDTLSQLYNICLVNFAKPVTLFEGPMDAFIFGKNSVANTGANKKFPMDINIRNFYDADSTGQKRSFEAINRGEPVFLWGKLKEEYKLPMREKWDLNDVEIWRHQNLIPKINYQNYFSKDPLDAIDI